MTFAEVADMHVASHEAGWRSPRHRQQWRHSLRDYVLPAIGELPVSRVDTGAVMKIIEPLWREKTETASRLRGASKPCSTMQKRVVGARARTRRAGAGISIIFCRNAAWYARHAPRGAAVARHRRFMQRLRRNSSISARCVEFLILTACCALEGDRACARDMDNSRTAHDKGRREHRVPLSEPSMAVLRDGTDRH
jgi:integrase